MSPSGPLLAAGPDEVPAEFALLRARLGEWWLVSTPKKLRTVLLSFSQDLAAQRQAGTAVVAMSFSDGLPQGLQRTIRSLALFNAVSKQGQTGISIPQQRPRNRSRALS
jgi:hypothetical protein